MGWAWSSSLLVAGLLTVTLLLSLVMISWRLLNTNSSWPLLDVLLRYCLVQFVILFGLLPVMMGSLLVLREVRSHQFMSSVPGALLLGFVYQGETVTTVLSTGQSEIVHFSVWECRDSRLAIPLDFCVGQSEIELNIAKETFKQLRTLERSIDTQNDSEHDR